MEENFIYTRLFDEATKSVQLRFDAITELNKRLFDNVLFEKYLDWDLPTIGLTFHEIIGQYNITVAAPTVGQNSMAPLLGTEGLQTMSETILRHAVQKELTAQDYRKIMELVNNSRISDAAKVQQLVNLIWGNVQTVVDAVLAKLDILFLRPLSNEGRLTIDDAINPEGGVRGVIDFQQPADNIATARNAWIDDNKTTVDCFEDIQGILDAAQDKVTLSKILCAPSIISYICRTSKVKQMIHGTDKSSRIVQLRDLNDYMQSYGFPVFEPVRRQVRIQKGKEITTYTPWNAANLVFIPDGKLGVVKNAYANSEWMPEPDVVYSNYGRIRVAQWRTGIKQDDNGKENFMAEVSALPVITEMNGIYTLKTQTA